MTAPIVVTHRRILRIAVPMMFAYLSTALVGVVSTAAVGRLADPALSAGIAIAAILFDVLLTSLNFLRSATLGLTALSLGAGLPGEARAVFQRSLLLALVLGAIILALRHVEATIGLPLLGAEGRVLQAAQGYVLLRALSAPAALGNFAILGALLGRGRAAAGLALQILLNGLNIVVCVWTVVGLGWGVRGAGLAALVGEVAAFVAGLLVLRRLSGPLGRGLGDAARDGAGWRRMGVLNLDILIRTLALLFAFAFFTREGAALGPVILAANAVHMQFFALSANCLDGFAAAAEQLAGTMIGARNRAGFMRAVRLSLGWSMASGRCHHAHLSGRRPRFRVAADGGAGSAHRGGAEPGLGRAGADGSGGGLPARRHLHRRHLVARHAEHDAAVAGRLSGRLGCADAAHGQCRAMARLADLSRHAGRDARMGVARADAVDAGDPGAR